MEQLKLKNSNILVIGAGGLASPLLFYLASSGVGSIDIMDYDLVDTSNLQRQIIHIEKNIGKNKAESAKEAIVNINGFIRVKAIPEKFSESNSSIVKDYSLVVVTVDDYFSRSIINKACFQYKIKQISAAAVGYEGWVSTFNPSDRASPCYNCLHSEIKAENIRKAKDIGVFAPMLGVVGSMQAAETIRTLLNKANTLVGTLMVFNFLDSKVSNFTLNKNITCSVCNCTDQY